MPTHSPLAVAALLVLVAASAPLAAAADPPGPEDLEPIRKFIVDTVAPIPRSAYGTYVCPNVGGMYTYHPPGGAELLGLSCPTPWCHGPVGVWCFNQNKLTQHDGVLCVVHQTVTPAEVPIPGQDAVSPVRPRCIEPLYHLSMFGGMCDQPVHVMCLNGSNYVACYAYVSVTGCVTPHSGYCRDEVQAMCWGFVYENGRPKYEGFCVLWVKSLKQCVTTTS